MSRKSIVKMIVDIVMLILMLLEFSKLHTGQLLHEIFGVCLFVLFIVHNLLNLSFYKNLFKGKYSIQRIITTVVDFAFLICMLFTILFGIPISLKVFKFLNLNGSMQIRTLHTIFGYWSLVILGLHLGLHFKMIFAKLKMNVLLYLIQAAIVIYGIKAMFDTNLGLYLTGQASFAMPTSIGLSLLRNFSIVLSLAVLVYQFEKIFLIRKKK